MKYKITVFDMDGTILNTLDDLKDSLNFTLDHFGYPKRTLEEVRRFVGNGIMKLIERGVPDGTSEEKIKEAYSFFIKHYSAHCADKTEPYSGITELLKKLRADGIKTAVVSNKADSAVNELCDKYFKGLFDISIGEREGVRRKPAPDSVNEVLKQLGLSREEAVYIGDSDVDVETAKNADMVCIGVEWGFRDRELLIEKGADYIVSNTEELYKLLK